MKTIVFVRIFNDFDHALPIIDYLIRCKGQDVTIYGLGEEYKNCNKHISYIENTLSNKVISFEDAFYSKRQKFYLKLLNSSRKFTSLRSKTVSLLFNVFLSQIRRIVYYLSSSSVENFINQLPVKSAIMADYGTEGQFPYKYIIRKSQRKGIPVIAYLHGLYIWTNLDATHVKKTKLSYNNTQLVNKWFFAKGISDFYDKYLVAPNAIDTHFKSNLYPSFDKFDRVIGAGIPRFTYEWIDRFAIKNLSTELDNLNSNKINVALFLSSENYQVNSDSLNEMTRWMIGSELINLVIKGHPRSKLSGLDENDLSISSKVSDLDSSDIIEWADVGILYGSSIALEMITRGVVVVVPTHIDKNRTVFEEYKACVTVDSLSQLADFFDKYPDQSVLPSKNDIDNFIQTMMYGGSSSYEELMDKYTYFLT